MNDHMAQALLTPSELNACVSRVRHVEAPMHSEKRHNNRGRGNQ